MYFHFTPTRHLFNTPSTPLAFELTLPNLHYTSLDSRIITSSKCIDTTLALDLALMDQVKCIFTTPSSGWRPSLEFWLLERKRMKRIEQKLLQSETETYTVSSIRINQDSFPRNNSMQYRTVSVDKTKIMELSIVDRIDQRTLTSDEWT